MSSKTTGNRWHLIDSTVPIPFWWTLVLANTWNVPFHTNHCPAPPNKTRITTPTHVVFENSTRSLILPTMPLPRNHALPPPQRPSSTRNLFISSLTCTMPIMISNGLPFIWKIRVIYAVTNRGPSSCHNMVMPGIPLPWVPFTTGSFNGLSASRINKA